MQILKDGVNQFFFFFSHTYMLLHRFTAKAKQNRVNCESIQRHNQAQCIVPLRSQDRPGQLELAGSYFCNYVLCPSKYSRTACTSSCSLSSLWEEKTRLSDEDQEEDFMQVEWVHKVFKFTCIRLLNKHNRHTWSWLNLPEGDNSRQQAHSHNVKSWLLLLKNTTHPWFLSAITVKNYDMHLIEFDVVE